jgi:hypothetical protein
LGSSQAFEKPFVREGLFPTVSQAEPLRSKSASLAHSGALNPGKAAPIFH